MALKVSVVMCANCRQGEHDDCSRPTLVPELELGVDWEHCCCGRVARTVGGELIREALTLFP